VEPAPAVTRLESLLDQMYSLGTQQYLSVDFLEWYLHTLETFDEIFGPESTARAEFERIRFEFPPAWQQQLTARLRQELQVHHNIDLPESFTIPLNNYHQQRLAEARELFLRLIIDLRR
jgi:hypothetical protein